MSLKPKKHIKELMASTLVTGFDILDKESEPYIPESIKQAIKDSGLPPDLQKAMLPIKEFGASSPIAHIWIMLIGMALGGAIGMSAPFMKLGAYLIDSLAHSYRLDPAMITQLYLREYPDKDEKEKWFRDLTQQGWSEERIDALKELAMRLPSPQDLVTWQAREVFEPDAIQKYGLADEFEKLDLSLFKKVGISEEMAKNYWMAHWQHASWMQVVEMLHRGLMTEADVWEWFRLVEIPPFWRQKLIDMSWNVPTRVDVRRWWDMRTINEDELRDTYQRQGYHGADLANYVLWTKVYVAFPDLLARYKNGWITLDEVKKELLGYGMPADRVEDMIETKIKKPAQAERVTKERDLTKAEIYGGVKKGIISEREGIELLIGMGYDEDEAAYIIELRVTAGASPETPLEFRHLVESYRQAVGLPFKTMPPELLEAERKLRNKQDSLAKATTQKVAQEVIDRLKADLAEAEASLAYQKELSGLNHL